MVRHPPSFTSLRAFEVVARKGNYSAAGRELNVTHAAVLQQVRALEYNLGMKLILRVRNNMELTPEGKVFAARLSAAFHEISQAVESVHKKKLRSKVSVSMTPSFAAEWMQPRLEKFRLACPDIDLIVHPSFELVDFNSGNTDVAIRFGSGVWENCNATLWIRTSFVVVVSTRLVPEKITTNEIEFSSIPWLQELHTTEVQDWIAKSNIPISKKPTLSFLPGNMILPSMRNGCGIACTAKILVKDDIQAGNVRVLFENDDHNVPVGYHLVTPRTTLTIPVIHFIKWLNSEINNL